MQPSSYSSTECQYAIARIELIQFQCSGGVCRPIQYINYAEWAVLWLSFCSPGSFFLLLKTKNPGRRAKLYSPLGYPHFVGGLRIRSANLERFVRSQTSAPVGCVR